MRCRTRHLLVVVTAAAPHVLEAQPLPEAQTRSATIAVTLRVLARAAFDEVPDADMAGALSATVARGERLRVAPAQGVGTRLVHDAATRVEISASAPVGPGGARLEVRYLCAFGDGLSVSATDPFDCAGAHVARPAPGRAGIQIGVGADVAAPTAGLPPGLYTGRVTLTAVHPGY